jgi:hypothetical protein
MEHLYSPWREQLNDEDKKADNRLLRKLKIALLFWLVSLIITIIWFTNSPAF